MKHYILFGGGLDSSALALHLCAVYDPNDVVLCHFSYGQKAAASEREVTRNFAKLLGCDHRLLNSDMRYSRAAIMENIDIIATDRNDNRLELRNPLLALTLASYIASTTPATQDTGYGADFIYLGFHKEKDNVFPDSTRHWFTYMNGVILEASKHRIVMKSPFSEMERIDIARIGYQARPDFFEITHTCYEGTECGKCKHCLEKALMKETIINQEHIQGGLV